MKLLTICIPTYNRSEELISTLKNLQLQIEGLESDISIIVSDNNSDAIHQEMLYEFHSKNMFFALNMNTQNMGIIGNIYLLNSIADSKYVWFLGDDDILLPNCVAKVWSILHESDINYMFLNYWSFVGEPDNIVSKAETFLRGYHNTDASTPYDLFKEYGTSFMFISASIYKKSLIDYVGSMELRIKNLAEPLYFFFSACKGLIYIENEICLLNRLSNISWANLQKQVSYVDIPEAILNLEYLNNYVSGDIAKILKVYYNMTFCFLLSLFYSNKSQVRRILKRLKSKFIYLFFSSGIFLVKMLIKKR